MKKILTPAIIGGMFATPFNDARHTISISCGIITAEGLKGIVQIKKSAIINFKLNNT